VIAYVIDTLPISLLSAIAAIALVTMQKIETVCITDDSEFNTGEYCATGENGPSTLAWIIAAVCILAALAFWIWNLGYRQGTTGSSVGKQLMKFKIVDENTEQPIGFGKSFLRELLYFALAGPCGGIVWLVAVLFPLWDAKRQTLVDKVFKNVALPI
jgi:uncharacterized RDD family membrane protein YckC